MPTQGATRFPEEEGINISTVIIVIVIVVAVVAEIPCESMV